MQFGEFFCDLAKALDIIKHEILLAKLHFYFYSVEEYLQLKTD
jgi:hypothetical protein